MALITKSYAEQLGRVLAEAARNEPLVEEVWVSKHPDGVKLWLVTQNIDLDAHRDLYALADPLYERFDRSDLEVFIVNPRFFRGSVRSGVPRHAIQIPLRDR